MNVNTELPLWRGMAHCRGVLPRSSRRWTRATTRPPILTTLTYLYLLYRPVLLPLTLTVVIIAGVSVPPLRRSAPAISRFCPVLGWRTMLQLLARRAAESNAFSIRNALWSRTEDDLLVQAVAKHSTSEALFRDWSCVSVCHFSWLPFLTILARSHKRC